MASQPVASTSQKPENDGGNNSQPKKLPLEKKLAAGVFLAFGLSLVITSRTTKYLYRRLQQPVEPTPRKVRFRDLKTPGSSFDFRNNAVLESQLEPKQKVSARGMWGFLRDGWRDEEHPPKPEEFNPALDAAQALGLATLGVLSLFGAGSGALLYAWGVTDVRSVLLSNRPSESLQAADEQLEQLESLKLALRSEMPAVLEPLKPRTVPDWARLPRSDNNQHQNHDNRR